jgi:hypothetical protein
MLLVLPAAMFVVVATTAPFAAFHQQLTLAGTPGRFAATVVRAGRSDARAALWLDNVFVASWLLVVPRLTRIGLERWAPERRRMVRWWRAGPRFALFAGVADLAENALSLALVGKRRPPTGLVLALTTVTWVKWALYAGAAAALVALVVGPVLAPVVRPFLRRVFGLLDRLAGSHPEPVPAQPLVRDDQERIGICLSGGGIRAASVAVGVLRGLDAPIADRPSLFRRSRWLVAVSGGSYTAGGWRISRRVGNRLEPVGNERHDGLFDAAHPWAATVRARRHYLRNGMLGLSGGLANVVVRTVLVFGAVLAATHVVATALGEAVPTRAVHPWFPYADQAQTQLIAARQLVPLRLVVPPLVILVAAAALHAWRLRRPAGERSVFTPRVVAAVGVALMAALVGVPAGVVYGRRLMQWLPVAGSADQGAGVLGGIAVLASIGALMGVALAEAKVKWLRLGGVVLAVGLLLVGGKITDAAARQQTSLWRSWPLGGGRLPVLVVAVVWLLVVDSIASHRLTLGGVYRKRLAATFALADGSAAPLAPLAYAAEPRWADLAAADGPELIVSATAHSSRAATSGVKGFGFTFRPTAVALHDRDDGTGPVVSMDTYPRGSWWDGYPRGWLVSRSMALSGAAIASAMGRQALGTTNSLLAALDLRLGAWVPNPRHAHWFADPVTSPRVHLGYLWKELVGSYQPDRDAFVYVADGGHRENLGLVELLRERPATVFCLDASGAAPGSFTTLDEAIALAHVELGVEVHIDLTPLHPTAGRPADCVAVGTITYPERLGGGTATLVYGRAQVDATAPTELLEYAASDRHFPDYSTLDQFLTDTEHAQLVALGEHVAARMVGSITGVSP